MSNTDVNTIQPIRFIAGKPMRLVGMARVITMETMDQIPLLWSEFGPSIGSLPGEILGTTYGVSYDTSDEGFRYMCAVEIDGDVPAGYASMDLPAQAYAVFEHTEHLKTLCKTIDAIFKDWLPRSKREAKDSIIEVYGPQFNPRTMEGGIELWLALEDE